MFTNNTDTDDEVLGELAHHLLINGGNLSKIATVFHIPASLVLHVQKQAFDPIELHLLKYPYPVVEIMLTEVDQLTFRDTHGYRPVRAIFTDYMDNESNELHGLFVCWETADKQQIWMTQSIQTNLSGGILQHDNGPLFIDEERALRWWSVLVSLTQMLDKSGSAHKLVDIVRVNEQGSVYPTRQQARAARRSGNDREGYVILPKANTTLRQILHTVDSARESTRNIDRTMLSQLSTFFQNSSSTS
jgi:hypothetical protein